MATLSSRYTTVGGLQRTYTGGQLYDLRISGENIPIFAAAIGFDHHRKAVRLAGWLESNASTAPIKVLLLCTGRRRFETTYNLSEPRNHSFIANGVVVRNCSEYMSLDNSSCNLASLNLMKFRHADGSFEVEKFVKSVELVITAMDISICFADFPTQKIAETTRAYRQLGIGYANLGALLMAERPAVRLRRGPLGRRGHHVADDRHGVPPLGRAGRRGRPVRRLRPQRRAAQAGHAQARRGQRRHQAARALRRPIAREATRQWQQCLKLGEKNGLPQRAGQRCSRRPAPSA